MGRLFVMDETVTTEELLSRISRQFGMNTKTLKEACSRQNVPKRNKSSLTLRSLQRTGIKKCDKLSVPEKSGSSVSMSHSSSFRSCALPHLKSRKISDFFCMNGMLRRIKGGRAELTVNNNSGTSKDQSDTLKTNRKRQGVAEEDGKIKRKRKSSCEILKEKLKQSMSPAASSKSASVKPDLIQNEILDCDVESVSSLEVHNLEAEGWTHMQHKEDSQHVCSDGSYKAVSGCSSRSEPESRTDNAWILDKDSSFSLGGIIDCEAVDDLSDCKPENDKSCCEGTSVKLQTMKDIPDWMYVALDCEMVGVGPKGKHSVLARCSIVDYDGNVVYDNYVRPHEAITDYRTPWSGIRPGHMKKAVPIDIALKDIRELIANKVVIGHAVYHDFKVLGVVAAHHFVRDTAQCRQLVDMAKLHGRGNSLKKLSEALLDRKIQAGRSGHCSVEDARATLDLFKLVRHSWEPELYSKWAKKDSQIFNKIASFVEAGTRKRELNNTEDFFSDIFWPSHVLD